MAKAALDISRLNRDEQFDLLDRLWESLGRDPQAFPLTQGQHEELDRRLDDLEAEGPTGLSWEERCRRDDRIRGLLPYKPQS